VSVGGQDLEELRAERKVCQGRRKEKRASRALPFYFQGCTGDDGGDRQEGQIGLSGFFERVR